MVVLRYCNSGPYCYFGIKAEQQQKRQTKGKSKVYRFCVRFGYIVVLTITHRQERQRQYDKNHKNTISTPPSLSRMILSIILLHKVRFSCGVSVSYMVCKSVSRNARIWERSFFSGVVAVVIFRNCVCKLSYSIRQSSKYIHSLTYFSNSGQTCSNKYDSNFFSLISLLWLHNFVLEYILHL